jgi:hypothetical protein
LRRWRSCVARAALDAAPRARVLQRVRLKSTRVSRADRATPLRRRRETHQPLLERPRR